MSQIGKIFHFILYSHHLLELTWTCFMAGDYSEVLSNMLKYHDYTLYVYKYTFL